MTEDDEAVVSAAGADLLVRAVIRRSPRVLKMAVARGAPVNIPDSAGLTPLYAAVYTVWMDGVKLLLEAGASPATAGDAFALAAADGVLSFEMLFDLLEIAALLGDKVATRLQLVA